MRINALILKALRDSKGVSGAELSREIGISRTAIWARINDLRALGYDIEASPHHGYRLLHSPPDVLHADDLLVRVGKRHFFAWDIRVFEEASSTNDLLARMAQEGAREGTVIFAETQSRGRGRLGREWTSHSRKGLWFSVLLRPDLRPQSATRLTITAAVALVRAINLQTQNNVKIKWPNDIFFGGKKVAGILTEINGELDRINYAIIGVGIDVNQTREEFSPELRTSATSLQIAADREIRRADLAVAVLSELDQACKRTYSGQFDAVAKEWSSYCSTLGQRVSIRQGERNITGIADSIDSEGALLVCTEDGRLETVVGGDVIFEK